MMCFCKRFISVFAYIYLERERGNERERKKICDKKDLQNKTTSLDLLKLILRAIFHAHEFRRTWPQLIIDRENDVAFIGKLLNLFCSVNRTATGPVSAQEQLSSPTPYEIAV